MASEIQNGRQFSMGCNFCSIEYFLNISFALCFLSRFVLKMEKIVEKVFSFWLKMAPLGQTGGWKWFFGHNFESIQLFVVRFSSLVLRHLEPK
jgi:hypothetical protein